MIFPAVEPDLNLLLLMGNAYENRYYLNVWRSEPINLYWADPSRVVWGGEG